MCRHLKRLPLTGTRLRRPSRIAPLASRPSQLTYEKTSRQIHRQAQECRRRTSLPVGSAILAMPEAYPDGRRTPLEEVQYVLRLYVAGSTPQSSRAIVNLKAICETYLRGRYVITVVDLYTHPERAREARIMVAPTLVREEPRPMRRMFGDLSDTDRVLAALDLPPAQG